jgi:hypothetical protein
MKAHKNEGGKMKQNEAIQYERRLTQVEMTQTHILEALVEIKSSINQRFDRIETIVFELKKETNARMDRIESRMDKLDNRLWTLVFTMFAGFGTILGVMAHGFGWV